MTRPFLILLVLSSFSLAAQTYVRGGVAVESAKRVTLHDRDCASTRPPALFGCGTGNDGLPFGARGELQRGLGFELALGREAARVRTEILLTSRSGLELDAQANFIGVAGLQPVSARVQSLSLLLAGAVDLAPKSWRVRPFLTGGAGVARNAMGPVTFAFPGISPEAVTITHGGEATGLTWTAGVGLTMDLGRGLSLDLATRHTDLGALRGARGDATIVRPTRTLRLEVAPIETEWQTRGVHLSVRRRF